MIVVKPDMQQFCVPETPQDGEPVDRSSRLIGHAAEELFLSKRLLCSAAVLVAINDALAGGLTRESAEALTSGLGEGLGGSGCVCGALSGGVLALGLMLGKGRTVFKVNNLVCEATRQLHNRFKSEFGATCCRALTSGLRPGSRRLLRQCARNTHMSARWSAEIILTRRPQLLVETQRSARRPVYDIKKAVARWCRTLLAGDSP